MYWIGLYIFCTLCLEVPKPNDVTKILGSNGLHVYYSITEMLLEVKVKKIIEEVPISCQQLDQKSFHLPQI